MAAKPEKDSDKGAGAKQGAGKKAEKEAKEETPEKVGKKRKLVVVLGIAGIALGALGGGGFFAYKAFFGAKPKELAAKPLPEAGNNAEASEADNEAHDKSAKSETTPANAQGAKDAGAAAGKEAESPSKAQDGASGEKSDKPEGESEAGGHGATGGDGNATTGENGAKTEEKGVIGGKASFGETFEIKSMDLNLGNPLENRYLRLSLSIEYRGGKEQLDEIQKREPQIRDLIIGTVSSKTRMELLSPNGKSRLRRELLNRFNEVLDKPVSAVYFTDFIVE